MMKIKCTYLDGSVLEDEYEDTNIPHKPYGLTENNGHPPIRIDLTKNPPEPFIYACINMLYEADNDGVFVNNRKYYG